MSQNYTVYHLHSMESLLDSCTSFEDYVDRAVELGQTSIGLTNHGNCYRWVSHKNYAESKGLKFLYGCEVYLTRKLFPITVYEAETFGKSPSKHRKVEFEKYWFDNTVGWYMALVNDSVVRIFDDTLSIKRRRKVRDNYHTILIAKNYKGFQEMNLLIDKSTQPDHFYYAPRITFDEFLGISDNVIKISACVQSPLNKYMRSDNPNESIFIDLLEKYDYYEIQPHNFEEQKQYNKFLYEASKKYHKPLIAATDTHNLDSYKAECRNMLMISNDIRYENESDIDLTYKTYDEVLDMAKRQDALPINVWKDALEETNVMASTVETFKIDTSFKYPKMYDDDSKVYEERVYRMYHEKLEKGIIQPDLRWEKNIKEEIRVFKKLNMMGFMLFMSELICWCWDNGIPVNVSRGSVGGSCCAYITNIIDLNPIQWNTIFYRFCNEDRVECGDIDEDFPPSQRHFIYEHIISKFGSDKTAYVLTMGTLADKKCIENIGRALSYLWQDKKYGHPKGGNYKHNNDSDNPWSLSKIDTIKKEYDIDKENVKKKYPELFYYFDGLLNTTVSHGIHAAGIICAPLTLPDNYGTFWSDGKRVISIDMDECHYCGLNKYDILGLKNVEIIEDTCKFAGIPYPHSYQMNWDDKNVWDHITDSPIGIFQFEGDYAFDLMKKFKPRKINDLSLLNAALRPSGASYRDKLIARIPNKNPSKMISDLLAPNNGYLVYQEDTLKFLMQICGLRGSEADTVRRAIGHKDRKVIEKAMPKILDGYCKNSDKPRQEAEEEARQFLKVINDSSEYQFGYNHSTGYSMLSYMCAYFRHYYPVEFITAYLKNASNDDDITNGTALARQMRIKIYPIKFRHSQGDYSCDHGAIYKGIGSVKNCNIQVADELYELRNNTYSTFTDLLVDIKEKTTANKTKIVALIKLDFFSEFGEINHLLATYALFRKFYDKKNVSKDAGLNPEICAKFALRETAKQYKFDHDSMLEMLRDTEKHLDVEPATPKELLTWQKELMGYCTYTEPDADVRKVFVLDLDTRYSPRFTAYCLKSGQTCQMKVHKNRRSRDQLVHSTFKDKPFEEGNILYMSECAKRHKVRKNADGNWVKTNDYEWWLNDYKVLQ